MKELDKEIAKYQEYSEYWEKVANSPKLLKQRMKTREEAVAMREYFEGTADGLIMAKCILSKTGVPE